MKLRVALCVRYSFLFRILFIICKIYMVNKKLLIWKLWILFFWCYRKIRNVIETNDQCINDSYSFQFTITIWIVSDVKCTYRDALSLSYDRVFSSHSSKETCKMHHTLLFGPDGSSLPLIAVSWKSSRKSRHSCLQSIPQNPGSCR